MAPQVIVYFHELPTTHAKARHVRRVGYQMSFIIDQALASFNIQKTKPGVEANKATAKVPKTVQKKTPSKNAAKNAKKRVAKVLRKKRSEYAAVEATEGCPNVATKAPFASTKAAKIKKHRVIKTNTIAANKTCTTIEIMIGSIPVTLITAEPIRVVSFKEEKKVLSSRKNITRCIQPAKKDKTVSNIKSQAWYIEGKVKVSNTHHLWGHSKVTRYVKSKKTNQKIQDNEARRVQAHMLQGASPKSQVKFKNQVMGIHASSKSQGHPPISKPSHDHVLVILNN